MEAFLRSSVIFLTHRGDPGRGEELVWLCVRIRSTGLASGTHVMCEEPLSKGKEEAVCDPQVLGAQPFAGTDEL